MLIVYKGKKHMINDKLLVENKVEHNLFKIIKIRDAITNLFEAELSGEFAGMEQEILPKLEGLEFQLQVLWGFPENTAYHMRQFNLRGCTCPKLDNLERVGLGSFIISESCPYHGMDLK